MSCLAPFSDPGQLTALQISIMPTEDEIRSVHTPILLSTRSDQPHFLEDQVQKHVNTYFHLLRHDIFGKLKVALKVLINNIEKIHALLRALVLT